MNITKNQKTSIIILVAVVVVGAFYWYSYRPAQIKKECQKVAETPATDYSVPERMAELGLGDQNTQDIIDAKYRNCLRSRGL